VQGLVDRGVTGDPRPHLKTKRLTTVNELLDSHLDYVAKLPSADTEMRHIEKLRAAFGERRIASLTPADFEAFRDGLIGQGRKLTYASRILVTCRSAAKRAYDNKQVSVLLKVPEFAKTRHKRAAPLKGPVLTPQEWAAIIDSVVEPHTLLLVVLLIHTGSRVSALLEATAAQIDWTVGTIDLNPAGRDPTDKRRPVLPIFDTLRPWLEGLPEGHLIRYRGKPIAEADTAFNATVRRAKIDKKANAYSARHSLGRWFRQAGIDTEEIGVFLGNGKIMDESETTLIYSPWAAEYLVNCRRAVEASVREVNTHTAKWDLSRPYATKPNWKKED
jgi:integrase